MARDYVRKRENQKPKSSAPRQILLVLASFLGGYLTATVFDVTSLTAWVNQHMATKNPKVIAAAPPPVKKAEPPKPKFEFYTLLSKDNSAPLANRPMPMTVAKSAPGPVPSSPNTSAQIANAISNSASVPVANAIPNVAVRDSKPVSTETSGSKGREAYLLQIASFNKKPDAERLKASLVLRGFDIVISPTAHGTVTWYRVIAGPFYSRAEAEKAQITVARSEKMKGMIRKMDA